MNSIKYDIITYENDGLLKHPNQDVTTLNGNTQKTYNEYFKNLDRIDWRNYEDKYLFVIHLNHYEFAQTKLEKIQTKSKYEKLKQDFLSDRCRIIIYIKDCGAFEDFENFIENSIFNNKNLIIIDMTGLILKSKIKSQIVCLNLFPVSNPEVSKAWTDRKLLYRMFERTYGFKKQFYFTTFNNVIKKHRVNLHSFLQKNNLLEKGICSFFSKYSLKRLQRTMNDYNFEFSSEDKPYSDDSFLNFDVSSDEFVWNGIFNYGAYFSSYFDIITETKFTYGDGFGDRMLMFTEKTWRPILLFSPFICLAQKGHLEKLKNYGFKTFHPLIDESYDNEKDEDKRLNMIMIEIQKLCDMSPKQIHEFYWSQRDTLIHNFNHYFEFVNNNCSVLYKKVYDIWRDLNEDN